MYFPVGWPKVLKIPSLGETHIKQVTSNRDRILFAILTDDSLAIWFCKPCVPIVYHRRTKENLEKLGTNIIVEWKPDSSKLVIVTSEGHLLFYSLNVKADQKGLYIQTDSPHANLRRDSAELFIKEIIPPLQITLSEETLVWDGKITSMVCITMTELMVATSNAHVLRYRWDGTQNRDYNLDLRRIPFCINQQVSKAVPIVEENTYIVDIEYSPLVGGFAIVLNDGRAAFLTASSLRFDPNQVQGIWAQGIEDATCSSMNHKYRLITFGRTNSECIVYHIDESTGGLAVSHRCVLSSKDYPGCPGPVEKLCWTPDGCAMVAAWKRGGIAMWSTFGALLMCSLGWDYGLHVDLQKHNPLHIISLEWGAEGYQLWMVRKQYKICDNSTREKDGNANLQISQNESDDEYDGEFETDLIQLDFVKSALTINPCMSHQSHLYLQGEDKLYVNSADTLIRIFSDRSSKEDSVFCESGSPLCTNSLAEGRQWLVLPVPSTYTATNWPIRYSAIDQDGQNMAIAGRTGLAQYSMLSRRWKLFGNESQEKDFIVSGGLLWWRDYMVLGCYSIIDNGDEIRFYPKDCKLDNKFAKIVRVQAPILLMNSLQDQLITFGSDGQVVIWATKQIDTVGNVELNKLQIVDISALCVHPACIVSITLTTLRTESGRGQNINSESMVLNVSGRLLMVQRETRNGDRYTCSMPTVLAGCVENVWVPSKRRADKAHLTEALWLFCGSHGMRVWLPLYPRDGDKSHTFMSKRIMLPFHLRIYPLAILFEDAIILGAENDTNLYTTDSNSLFSLPFSVLQRTSQVYLHQILRQLIRRNLGYHAWEIARSCTNLPYFPHSLELLLHEVLEEEATSKEPIPDAQLPSVIEFIMEFPVYLQTVVQCARKTEIALWPYLFSAAGKPKDLFQECMAKRHLDTAASYLIILQNLETSSVSRQHATLLLDTALNQSKWELAKDLVRFLRAIDPTDVESPRNSMILPNKLNLSQTTPPVSPNAEDISLILGNVQRVRSYSTTITPKIPETKVGPTLNATINESPIVVRRKKSVPANTSKSENRDSTNSNTAEEFFIDVILQRHARRLLSSRRLTDLGYFAAHLDFHLVAWLGKERDRAARIDDFVTCLKQLHEDFNWPYPTAIDLSSGGAQSPPESPNIEDKFKALHVDTAANMHTSSQVGDSGYISFPGIPCTGLVTPQNTLEMSSQITEAEITNSDLTQSELDSPNLNYAISSKNGLITSKQFITSNGYEKKVNLYEPPKSRTSIGNYRMMETQIRANMLEDTMSTVSSVWGEDRDLVATSVTSENWEVPSTQILEQLSNAGNKGSQRSEVQLRYLLQLFMEASCLEWSLLISVLLRDALAVLRTVNAAKSPDQSIDSVKRLKQGLQILHYWTYSECLGYKAFMLAIQNQISVLSTILATKIQHQQILEHQRAVSATLSKVSSAPNSRSRNASLSQDHVLQSCPKDRLSSGSGSSHTAKEVAPNSPAVDEPTEPLEEIPVTAESSDAIILGAENDTNLYTTDSNSLFSLPFSVLQRTSQVYLHQILRQLIRRNLGYHAWEIARSCTNLPYFPHSLELLLHEVLEEEATSKEPIPDAQLPSVIEFIMEFPVYLQTVVQCARKTEIALWPYLFSAAGKPKDLFQECMAKRHLDTAASYLIILQNLETSSVSRQHATLLLDTALNQSKWELAKDLVGFLRAIDPTDVESPRNSMILPNKLNLSQTTPPVSPNAEDKSLILGNVQRVRSYSTTITPKIPETKVGPTLNATINESPIVVRRKKSVPANTSKSENRDSTNSNTAEEFFIDVILQRHARRLLSSRRLTDLGYFAAHLDFHLVAWLGKERDRAARIDDFVTCLKQLHEDFNWPYPTAIDLSSGGAQSPPESPNIEDKFKALHVDTAANMHTSSQVGDSGYISFPGIPCTGLVTPQNTLEMSSQITEAEITNSDLTQSELDSPNLNYAISSKNGLITSKQFITSNGYEKKVNLYEPPKSRTSIGNYRMMETQIRANMLEDTISTVSSVWGEDRDLVATSVTSENWEVPSTQILEQLSNAGNKGSQRSEVQLRYLLQLFMEASCLEWSLLISVLLRDALAVLRTVNAAKSPDQSIDSVKRLKQGLQILHYWTYSECLGYKAFMLAIQNQISVLSTILATKIQHQQILEHQRAVSATLSKVSSAPNSRSRNASLSQDHVLQSCPKDRLSSGSGSSHTAKEVAPNSPAVDEPTEPLEEIPVTAESSGCILS